MPNRFDSFTADSKAVIHSQLKAGGLATEAERDAAIRLDAEAEVEREQAKTRLDARDAEARANPAVAAQLAAQERLESGGR